MPPDGTPSLLPGPGAFDDEEPLARLDEAESARLANESGITRRVRELALEPLPLAAEACHLRGALRERVLRVNVRAQRPVVEERDQAERADPEPAPDQYAAPRAAPLLARSGHRPRVRPGTLRSCLL